MGMDANQSNVIDSLGGARALLNETIRNLYRQRMKESQSFTRDTVTKNTVAVTSGVGACPDGVMREFLPTMGQFTDDNGSNITYFNYNIDADSGVTFSQLGYVRLDGDNFYYTAPSPTLDTYTGNLFVLVPTFPVITNMASAISFPTTGIIDDLCSLLAATLVGSVASVPS